MRGKVLLELTIVNSRGTSGYIFEYVGRREVPYGFTQVNS
jgi:hypothetical protein